MSAAVHAAQMPAPGLFPRQRWHVLAPFARSNQSIDLAQHTGIKVTLGSVFAHPLNLAALTVPMHPDRGSMKPRTKVFVVDKSRIAFWAEHLQIGGSA